MPDWLWICRTFLALKFTLEPRNRSTGMCATGSSTRPGLCERRSALPASYVGALSTNHPLHPDWPTGDHDFRGVVIRNVEVIGEAAKRVSPESRVRMPSLDWKSIC